MHTLTIGPMYHDHYVVHHNGDFSGDVEIQKMSPSGSPAVEPKPNGDPIVVPFSILYSIVGEFVRGKLTARVEHASVDELVLKGLRL